MLEVEYTYHNSQNYAESGSSYQWYISDSKEGKYTKLNGIHAKTIILLKEYVGKYLKCEIRAHDTQGNQSSAIISTSTDTPVKATEGNPLTNWLYEAKYGLSHHLLKESIEQSYASALHEQWNRNKQTWAEFVDQFDVVEYARQVKASGAKFVLLTLNQNSGYYITPIAAYDKKMQQVGLIGKDEPNPMTARRDLPDEIMNELARYGIRLMLYHPSNPPNSAHWESKDYRVTQEVFHYTPHENGAPNGEARKMVNEIISELGDRYGRKLASFWFDGFYADPASVYNNMDNAYNISDFANAAKKGNPYRMLHIIRGGDFLLINQHHIVTFRQARILISKE
jgi:hypothetical protein